MDYILFNYICDLLTYTESLQICKRIYNSTLNRRLWQYQKDDQDIFNLKLTFTIRISSPGTRLTRNRYERQLERTSVTNTRLAWVRDVTLPINEKCQVALTPVTGRIQHVIK